MLNMVTNLEGFRNYKSVVLYDHELRSILVQDCLTGRYRAFYDLGDMYALFLMLKEEANEHTDYESALRFFNPIVF